MKYIKEIIDGKPTMVCVYVKKRELMNNIDILKHYYPNKKREIGLYQKELQELNNYIKT
jgi:hypothetical protein